MSIVSIRICGAAVWTGVCAAASPWALFEACSAALAGSYGWAAFGAAGTLWWMRWGRSARRRWRLLALNAVAHRSLAEMRRTRRCAPPGHAWGPHPGGTLLEPAWCICGDQYRNQDECDALNWKCEP